MTVAADPRPAAPAAGAPAPALPRLEEVSTIILDFDGVFTDNAVYVSESGEETVRCSRADGLGLDMLRRHQRRRGHDVDVFILSTERNLVVSARAKKLRLECTQGVGDKLAQVQAHFASRRPEDADPFAGLLYVGNDLNDLPVMEKARWSVAPADAHERVRRIATHVLPVAGGAGVVRALVEGLLDLNRMTLEEIRELVSDC